jgi:hypothetical protein
VDLKSVNQKLHARSAALLLSLENRLDRILQGWLLVAGLASAARIATAPVARGDDNVFPLVAPYLLLVLAPVASTLLALHWFERGDSHAQPVTRLARVGRWRPVSALEAKRHPLYGTSGIMVSLMVGMMLNVPVRTLEYFAAMPPVAGGVPAWLSALHFAMTFDVVLFTSLYMIAFVAALRRVPLFPRLLAAIWLGDLAMQVFTAQLVVNAGHVPHGVAAALQALLTGNVKKVLISVALWLPYLLLSKRVNVTYRNRVPAR